MNLFLTSSRSSSGARYILTPPTQTSETKAALAHGATELDAVLNRALLRADEKACLAELVAIRSAAPAATLKLILETSQLSEAEIVRAVDVASRAGWEFVKTSTGFCGGGARGKDVRVMRERCGVLARESGGRRMRVKASGGIRTLGDAVGMVEAGAERLGCSAGVGILGEAVKVAVAASGEVG